LLKNIRPQHLYPYQVYPQVLHHDPKLEKLKEYNIITGHFSTPLISSLCPDATIFTVLRDPVERSISHLFHLRQEAVNMNTMNLYGNLKYSHFVSDECLSNILNTDNIEDMLKIEEVCKSVSNIFTRHLGTKICLDNILYNKDKMYCIDSDPQFVNAEANQILSRSKELIKNHVKILRLDKIDKDFKNIFYSKLSKRYKYIESVFNFPSYLRTRRVVRPMSMTLPNFSPSVDLIKNLKILNSLDYELIHWARSQNLICD
jgi:hypothetical protein